MPPFADPVVAWHGADDPSLPLVVLLHGRGADERGIIGLAGHLPEGLSYAAVRAPIGEGGGYAWFANRGIGRPVAESLSATMEWFREWLDGVAPKGRPVILAGFSGGAAFAGGLILDEPERYAGAAILYGTLPFDAGVPVTPARLAGLPVFVAQGQDDHVIPRELMDATWSYLTGASGAPAYAMRPAGGHGITAEVVSQLAGWIAERAHFVDSRPVLAPTSVAWPLPGGALPERTGDRPEVTWSIPQSQRSDQSPSDLQEQLFARIAALPGVNSRQSAISVPGARGFFVTPSGAVPMDAYLVPQVGEFAHLHPEDDGSLHLALPPELARDAVERGWAVAHPLAGIRLARGMVMVYGPRDAAELDVVSGIVTAAHQYATAG